LAKLRRDGVPAVRVSRGRNSRDALANAANYLRKRAIDGGYDYLLMLECDIFPQADIIEKLLKNANPGSLILQEGCRVVGAPYHITDGKTTHLCVFMPERNEATGLVGTKMIGVGKENEFLYRGLQRVHGMGVGCTLIHKSILEKFSFWYSELDDDRMKNVAHKKHPDVYFYLDLHNAQIPVFCDTDSYVVHKPSDWKLVKDI
jgi:hypothetical protein